MGETDRSLIWIPIIHTQVDQGSMSDTVRELYVRKLGEKKWDQHVRAVESKWRRITETIQDLELDYAHVRLYQDGLPVSGHEAAIVRDLAHAGSRNHSLLLELMDKGASLTGTESPELLVEEYELAQQVLVSLEGRKVGAAARGYHERSKRLLERRDRFIAGRIHDTLQPGETGLLFLGLLHSLDGRLPRDVRLRRIDSVLRDES